MNLLTLSLLVALGQTPEALPNLDFRSGKLTGWQGDGFYLTTADPRGPSLSLGVCSSDRGRRGRTGMLRYVFEVPETGGILRCSAYAALGKNCSPSDNLDVLVLARGKHPLQKYVLTDKGWQPSARLLPRLQGKAREYYWDLSAYAGQMVQIVLLDQDKRPGCHVFCSGFRLTNQEAFEAQEFSRFMLTLAEKNQLTALLRYESKHFTAWSNADEEFTKKCLRNCELLHAEFFERFQGKGFALRRPAARLMVAIFDRQSGFEAYLGQKVPPTLAGVYHPGSNRLVVYDLGQNETFLSGKKQALEKGQFLPHALDRMRFVETVNRQAREFRTDMNLSTTMHEAAHHLSFNCGLLNRDGHVPLWLAEGLACYCEPTSNGSWQGPGEPNRPRIAALAGPLRGQGKLLSLTELVTNDLWLRDSKTLLLGYAQSWALFRLLMEERPKALRTYLSLVYPRRGSEQRLTDFRQAFGADLTPLEERYRKYVQELVKQHGPR
jgi:hypothetical protein